MQYSSDIGNFQNHSKSFLHLRNKRNPPEIQNEPFWFRGATTVPLIISSLIVRYCSFL